MPQSGPRVLDTIHACNIRNYSIFRHATTLFAYFEYVGDDYEADMEKMAADPKTQEWWRLNRPLQVSWETGDEWWTHRPRSVSYGLSAWTARPITPR